MSAYLNGFLSLLSWSVFGWLALGTVLGMATGSIPGLGPSVAISLLLPVAFHLRPLQALVFLASLYQASEYAGSITAIAVATPGHPNAAVLVLDGYPMKEQGRAGKAFAYSLWAAVFGSVLSSILILLLALPLAHLALGIGPLQLTALDLFAFTLIGVVTAGSALKGVTSVGIGVLLSTVGTDIITGEHRFTLGLPQLFSGIPIVPFIIALFAIPAALDLLTSRQSIPSSSASGQRVWLTLREVMATWKATVLGAVLGCLMGILPGFSGAVPPWITYAAARGLSKHPERFGKGHGEGISAPEATNGAVMHATLVPTFFVGIPGTPTSAVLLGAMTIVGLQPGPLVFKHHPSLILGILEALVISSLLLWIVGMSSTSLWVWVLARIDRSTLGIGIGVLAVVGGFAATGTAFGPLLVVIIGGIAYLLSTAGFSLAGIILGFVLGSQFENSLRTSLALNHGSVIPYISHPFSAVLLAAAAASIVWSLVRFIRSKKVSGRSDRESLEVTTRHEKARVR